MTEDKASVEIVRRYWQAVIDGNWEMAARLRPLASSEDWKWKYSINPPEELVEIGQTYQQEGCSIGPVVPCTVRFADNTIREVKISN